MKDFVFNMGVHKIFTDCCVCVWMDEKIGAIFLYKPQVLIMYEGQRKSTLDINYILITFVYIPLEQPLITLLHVERRILLFKTSHYERDFPGNLVVETPASKAGV